MNDIEIYGMKVNDIKDVREVLTILYAIQEQQKEISERQASIMQSATKLNELTNKLDSMLSRMNEVEENLSKFVEATRTVNENIGITYNIGVKVLDNVQKIQKEISSLVESSKNAIKEAEEVAITEIGLATDTLNEKIGNGAEHVMRDLKNKISSTVDDAVKEVSEKVGSLSTVVNVKVFLVSIVLGIIAGYVLYHYSDFLHFANFIKH
jgi:DNA repair exonuclease SbcCD ATPase subunit